MGDSTTVTLHQFQQRWEDEAHARDRLLGGFYLYLNKDSMHWILNHIDCFVSASRCDKKVKMLVYPYALDAFDGHDEGVWHKLGQALGNLQAVEILCIGDLPATLDWEILARILSHLRQRIALSINDVLGWDTEESRLFAGAIHGNPTITSFRDEGEGFPYETSDALYSALATLPALESISLSNRGHNIRREDESALANPDSLSDLLRVASLRSVCFDYFSFTPALRQATANAFMEGSAVTNLEFSGSISAVDLSPVLLALRHNTVLKTSLVDDFGLMDEPLCTAMQNGLGMNETLESLEFNNVRLCDDNAALWCRALSFLRTSKTLKSLVVDVTRRATEACLSAVRIDIAAMLQDNTSLESLSVQSFRMKIKADEYFALITALQRNKKLKSLVLQRETTLESFNLEGRGSLKLTRDEDKQMAALLKENYALESLPNIDPENEPGDAGAILRLNAAGRRYLIEDGFSVSKGVEVLSAVSNEINCVFLHLLANPTLCDIEHRNTATGTAANPPGRRLEIEYRNTVTGTTGPTRPPTGLMQSGMVIAGMDDICLGDSYIFI